MTLMKNLAKKFLSYDFFLQMIKGRRYIFLYHDISDEQEKHFSGEYYSTTAANFKRQIRFLTKKFEIIPLDALVTDADLSPNKHYASIVFDDGFFSVAEIAEKILFPESIPFAVFVNKSAIVFDQSFGSSLIIYKNDQIYLKKLFAYLKHSSISFEEFSSNPIAVFNEFEGFDENFRKTYMYQAKRSGKRTYLDGDAVKYLYSQGVLIGSHSTDHYLLNKCTEETLYSQINENREFLEKLLMTRIDHFAIPFGKKEHYDEKVIETIFEFGHKFVYSTNPVPFKTEDIKKTHFLFPRFGLLNDSPEQIMFYLNRTVLKRISI